MNKGADDGNSTIVIALQRSLAMEGKINFNMFGVFSFNFSGCES